MSAAVAAAPGLSIASIAASLAISSVILFAVARRRELRQLPSRLQLHPVALNVAWTALALGCIVAGTLDADLPCRALGPTLHAASVASIMWFCAIFVDLQRKLPAPSPSAWVTALGRDEKAYVLATVVAGIGAVIWPLLVQAGTVDDPGVPAGEEQPTDAGDLPVVYTTGNDGMCYLSPRQITLRMATLSAPAAVAFGYMCCVSMWAVNYVRSRAPTDTGTRNRIIARCVRYLGAFGLLWGLWIAEDAFILARLMRQSAGSWPPSRATLNNVIGALPPALDVAKCVAFYAHATLCCLLYGSNQWRHVRSALHHKVVTVLSKTHFLAACACECVARTLCGLVCCICCCCFCCGTWRLGPGFGRSGDEHGWIDDDHHEADAGGLMGIGDDGHALQPLSARRPMLQADGGGGGGARRGSFATVASSQADAWEIAAEAAAAIESALPQRSRQGGGGAHHQQQHLAAWGAGGVGSGGGAGMPKSAGLAPGGGRRLMYHAAAHQHAVGSGAINGSASGSGGDGGGGGLLAWLGIGSRRAANTGTTNRQPLLLHGSSAAVPIRQHPHGDHGYGYGGGDDDAEAGAVDSTGLSMRGLETAAAVVASSMPIAIPGGTPGSGGPSSLGASNMMGPGGAGAGEYPHSDYSSSDGEGDLDALARNVLESATSVFGYPLGGRRSSGALASGSLSSSVGDGIGPGGGMLAGVTAGSRADAMTPSKGKPVHIYHIGAYSSTSSEQRRAARAAAKAQAAASGAGGDAAPTDAGREAAGAPSVSPPSLPSPPSSSLSPPAGDALPPLGSDGAPLSAAVSSRGGGAAGIFATGGTPAHRFASFDAFGSSLATALTTGASDGRPSFAVDYDEGDLAATGGPGPRSADRGGGGGGRLGLHGGSSSSGALVSSSFSPGTGTGTGMGLGELMVLPDHHLLLQGASSPSVLYDSGPASAGGHASHHGGGASSYDTSAASAGGMIMLGPRADASAPIMMPGAAAARGARPAPGPLLRGTPSAAGRTGIIGGSSSVGAGGTSLPPASSLPQAGTSLAPGSMARSYYEVMGDE